MIADPGPIPELFTRTASGPASAVDNLPEQTAEEYGRTIEVPKAEVVPPAPPQFTIAQVTGLYLKTKDELEVMSKRHQAEAEPLNKRLELTKAWMLKYLNDQGLDNAKTEHGLCYKSNIMSTTVDPEGGWEQILTHVFGKAITRALDAIENGAREPDIMPAFLSEPALALLNRSVNKTAVKELLDQNITVPGVKIAQVTQLNVRRS